MTRDMNTVRMAKSDLLSILRANRATHRGLFDEAMEAYRQKSIEILEAHIERIKSGAPERVNVSLPLPEDHTDTYDLAISMLEHNLDDEVLLSSHDYDQYVLDNWGWKASFSQTYTAYTGATPGA